MLKLRTFNYMNRSILKLQKRFVANTNNEWYKDGLKFKCTGCGKCCTGAPGWVWITDEDAHNISRHLNISLEKFYAKFTRRVPSKKGYTLIEKPGKDGLDCIFLENKKCTIYKWRPTQCKTYPFWENVVNSEENWKDEAKYCEGINHPESELVSGESIKRMVMETIQSELKCEQDYINKHK